MDTKQKADKTKSVVIRVDEDIYRWLRSLAEGFDTPNKVLRRIMEVSKAEK